VESENRYDLLDENKVTIAQEMLCPNYWRLRIDSVDGYMI
jgi:hypothetical protein